MCLLLLKWRTDRMTNVAAYALGGVKYLRDFQSQEDVRQEEDILRLRSGNVALDLGAGIDIFLLSSSWPSKPRPSMDC